MDTWWFCVLTIADNTAVDLGCRYLFEIMISFPLDVYLEEGLLNPRVLQLLLLLKPPYSFHNSCPHLHSCWQCSGVHCSLHSLQHLLSLVFLIRDILRDVRWYLIVVLIYINLMVIDAENLLMHLFIICRSSLEKCLFMFWMFLLLYARVEWVSCTF